MLTSHPPTIWRELHRGQKGPDVSALQRCLFRLLGPDSVNALNGTYGKGTATDVAKARAELGLPGGSETVGQLLFDKLWAYADHLAVTQYAKPAAPNWKPPLLRIPLSVGMKGNDVLALQRGLWRLVPGSKNARNGTYGSGTAEDVVVARKLLGLDDPVGGKIVGRTLWAAISRYMDDAALSLELPEPPPPVATLRAKIVEEARWALAHASQFRYAQIRPMPGSLHNSGITRIDCSAFVTLSHKDAGAPNPNRADGLYDGYGYTGTLESVCRWVAEPLPGDFAEYVGHTALVEVPNGRDASVISDGHDPITRYSTARYRSDFRGFLRSPHLG